MPYRPPDGNVVDVEDSLTWPESLCNLLAGSKDLLCRFEKKQVEISNAPGARFTRTNEFADERSDVVRKGELILAAEKILGFHCTRLLPYEAKCIRARGLRLPSPDFLNERIGRAVNAGYLAPEIADRLLRKNQAADPSRLGSIGFGNAQSMLRHGYLVHRFFDSWGGEALYNSHEDDPTTGPALRSLGQAYIVAAALPAEALCVPRSPAEYFISAFLQSIGIKGCNDAAFESTVKGNVPPAWLLEVIGCGDPRFSVLTGREVG